MPYRHAETVNDKNPEAPEVRGLELKNPELNSSRPGKVKENDCIEPSPEPLNPDSADYAGKQLCMISWNPASNKVTIQKP